MGLKNQMGQGPNYVPAYQTSGTPFVTSSRGPTVVGSPAQCVKFSSVTRFIEVRNTGGGGAAADSRGLRIGFSERGVLGFGGSVSGSLHERNGDHANFFVIPASGSTGRLEVRCKELWVAADTPLPTGFTLIAGLTGIHPTQFPTLTGSNGFVGVG